MRLPVVPRRRRVPRIRVPRDSVSRTVVGVAMVLVAGCAGGGSRSADPDVGAILERIESHCTDIPAPDLGGGTLCIDNGFRISSDDFSFANWGRSTRADGNVSIQTLVDLFGRAAVCAPGPDDECILRPSTVQRLDEWNNQIAGGRCEGFAALSTRFFLGYEDPATYRNGATRVAQLERGDPGLDESLAYWWTTQFLPEVTDRAAASRARSPLELVDDIIVGLADATGPTLGLYDGGSGHAVTPFAVTRRDGDYVVHVYDNNQPGERREVRVDAGSDTWTYERASRGPDGSWRDWSGGAGSFEVTPMSARRGPFTCDFCTTIADGGPMRISIASRDPSSPGRLRLTTGAGSLSSGPDGVTSTIEGATWSVTKGLASALTVNLPASVGDVDVAVTRDDPVLAAGDVVVGVRRAGHPDLQVQGDLAAAPDDDSTVVLVRRDATTVRAPRRSVARVSVADATSLTTSTVEAGTELVVRALDAATIEVALKGRGAEQSARLVAGTDHVVRTLRRGEGTELVADVWRVAPVPISPPRAPSFSGRADTVVTSTTTSVTSTTSDPDRGPPPSIVVTLPD